MSEKPSKRDGKEIIIEEEKKFHHFLLWMVEWKGDFSVMFCFNEKFEIVELLLGDAKMTIYVLHGYRIWCECFLGSFVVVVVAIII